MNARRFDDLTRYLARRRSRRAALRLLGIGAVSLAGREPSRARGQGSPSIQPVATEEPAAALPGIEYFALGDSVASGHGLMDDDGPDPPECCADGQDACRTNSACCQSCRRSTKAYPHQAQALLEEDGYSVDRFVHLACTGARATDPRNPDQLPLKWLHNQVDQALTQLSDRPTLVTITIGANDFEWASPSAARYWFGEAGDTEFFAWVDRTSAAAADALQGELDRLLAKPNVVVVLTDVFNPFNKESWFFGHDLTSAVGCAARPGVEFPNIPVHFEGCYGRADYGVTLLNTSYLALVNRHLAETNVSGAPPRLAIAQVYDAFQGHESPRGEPRQPTRTDRRSRRPCCGNAAPDVADTWIQHRYDDRSNSRPCLEGEWTGDCFHPNAEGARQIAIRVKDAALPLLASLVPIRQVGPRITTGPTVVEVTATSATIAWTTDEPADSTVEYGDSEAYGELVASSDWVTDHALTLGGLEPGQTYHFRVHSRNANGEVTLPDASTFTTLEWPPTLAPQPTEPDGCPTGLTRCGRECVDLSTSGWHCGACGHQCGVFQTCCDGVCGCPESMAMFPGGCAPGEPIC